MPAPGTTSITADPYISSGLRREQPHSGQPKRWAGPDWWRRSNTAAIGRYADVGQVSGQWSPELRGVPSPIDSIETYFATSNDYQQPYVWTATAESIMSKGQRARTSLEPWLDSGPVSAADSSRWRGGRRPLSGPGESCAYPAEVRHDEYVRYDATGLAELVRAGEVNGDELVAAANARIDAVNDLVNAVVHRISPPVPASDGGPFTGVPLLLKDMDGQLAGHPCSYGSRSLARWRPESDSELVTRYRDAGLRIIGKSNCPEFGIMGITEPEHHGPTRNPWNVEHVPGGSSGGSAAAVAAGITPVATAGDGGGSIRIPASACGLFGLKPSRGLMPLGPEGDPWLGLVTRHVLTRSVRDSAGLLDATTAPFTGSLYAQPRRPRSYLGRLATAPRRLTVGVSRLSFLDEPLHPDCVKAVDDAARLLESLGHRVVELDLPIAYAEVAQAYLTIVAAAVAADVRATEAKTGEAPRPTMFERSTWFLKQVGDTISARELYEAHEVAAVTARSLAAMFDTTVDVHLSATMAAPPAKVGELGLGIVEKVALSTLQRLPSSGIVLRRALQQLAHDSLERTPNTQVYNLTGTPAMNLPLWVNPDNLPVGVQVAGPFGSEELLLRLAQQVHDARPWVDRLPSLPGV